MMEIAQLYNVTPLDIVRDIPYYEHETLDILVTNSKPATPFNSNTNLRRRETIAYE